MTRRGGGGRGRGEPKVMAFSVLLTLNWYVLSRGDSRGWRVTLLPLPILPSGLGGKNLRHSEEVKLDREDEVKGTGLPLPCHLLQCETLTGFPLGAPPPTSSIPVPPPRLFSSQPRWRCVERELRSGQGLLTQISWTDRQPVLRNCVQASSGNHTWRATGNLRPGAP